MARRDKYVGKPLRKFHLETLERRILFSADAALSALELVPEPVSELVVLQQEQANTVDLTAQDPTQEHKVHEKELVIVDSALPNLQMLLDDLASTIDKQTQVVVLDATADALPQISSIIARQDGLTALHLMSHGSSGSLELAGQQINTLDLLSAADELSTWRSAFAQGADILLYGCEVAADGQGRQFVDTMARLTGADVSASNDLTGDADQGGDWQLEHAHGEINSDIVVSVALQNKFEGTLNSHPLPDLKFEDSFSVFAC